MPDALELVILILAAYRIWRLFGQDDFPPVARARDWITGAKMGRDDWEFERPTLAHFLGCPFCLGFWISLVVYAAWLSVPQLTIYAMTPFAISGAVGLLAKNLDE